MIKKLILCHKLVQNNEKVQKIIKLKIKIGKKYFEKISIQLIKNIEQNFLYK